MDLAHYQRVGELATQRLDLNTINDGLRIAQRFPPCQGCARARLSDGERRQIEIGERIGQVIERPVGLMDLKDEAHRAHERRA